MIRNAQNLWGRRDAVAGRASALVLSCGVVLVLSSCNTPAGVQQSGAPKMLTPEEALVFPPPGGPEILTVINRNYSNAVQQDVILRSDAATPGQNSFKIQLFGPQRPDDTGKDGLSNSSLRVSAISREIRTAFPGVAMATSAEYLQNSYGAFSYAAGHGRGKDTCIYGWQQIRAADSMRQGLKNLGRINVTLRLCQSGVTVSDLLTVMYNYTITGNYKSENWNPYGTAPEPDKGIGRSGSPIYPVNAAQTPLPPGGQAPAPAQALTPRVVRQQPRPAANPPAPDPVRPQVSSRVVIPSPPDVSGTRPASVPAPARRIETKQVSIPSPPCIAGAADGQTCN